jgi:dUTP pyrophosphatase
MTDLAIPTTMLPIKIVVTSPKWVPVYQSEGAAGADLFAAIDAEVQILPGKATLIPAGVRIEVPEGFEVQIRPRSGLALKSLISVLNSPGTIDSDYRGEVGVILMNHGHCSFTVLPGMRIAQMVVCPIVRAQFIPVACLSDTNRGDGGFGHTGL